jgi:hypothetical protein
MQTKTKGNQKFAIESESMFCDSQWTLAVLLFRCVLPFADWKFVFLNFGKSDAHARHVVDLFFAHVSCLVWANTWTHVLKQNRTTSTWQRSHGVPWYHLHTLRCGKSALFFHTSVHLAPTWGWPTNINASLNCHSSPKSGWCHRTYESPAISAMLAQHFAITLAAAKALASMSDAGGVLTS